MERTKQEIAKIINCAIDLLRDGGWIQGTIALTKDGNFPSGGPFSSEATQFCLIGALQRCSAKGRSELNSPLHPCNIIIRHGNKQLGDLAVWNDDAGRKITQVVRALRKWRRELCQ